MSTDNLPLAQQILDQIFVQQERGISLPPESLDVMQTLIVSSQPQLARWLVGALGLDSLLALTSRLGESIGMEWLQWVDPTLTPALFSRLDIQLQRKVLADLYANNPVLYDRLRPHLAGKLMRIEGLFLSRVKWAEMVETRLDRLVAQLLDPAVGPADMEALAAVLQRDFDWEDVLTVVNRLAEENSLREVPVISSADFRVHLKFHWLLSEFPRALSEQKWMEWDRKIVDSLFKMPDTQWVLKVLAQFPQSSIDRILKIIYQQTHHSELILRNAAMKLINEIKASIDTGNFENVGLSLISLLETNKEPV